MTRMAGLPEGAAVEVWEEIKFEPSVMVDLLKPSMTLNACQLEDGDVLILQPALSRVSKAVQGDVAALFIGVLVLQPAIGISCCSPRSVVYGGNPTRWCEAGAGGGRGGAGAGCGGWGGWEGLPFTKQRAAAAAGSGRGAFPCDLATACRLSWKHVPPRSAASPATACLAQPVPCSRFLPFCSP
jgi:hypothetical protein